MDINITIPLWVIPTALTALTVLVITLWPIRPSRGDYDFGPLLDSAVLWIGGIILILLIWLVYAFAT